MNFGMIKLTQSIEIEQNFATQILIALLFTLKLNNFLKIFLMMLRNGSIRLTMIKMIIDLFWQARIKKMKSKDELKLQEGV